MVTLRSAAEIARLDDQANALPDDLRARLKTSLEELARTLVAPAAKQQGRSGP